MGRCWAAGAQGCRGDGPGEQWREAKTRSRWAEKGSPSGAERRAGLMASSVRKRGEALGAKVFSSSVFSASSASSCCMQVEARLRNRPPRRARALSPPISALLGATEVASPLPLPACIGPHPPHAVFSAALLAFLYFHPSPPFSPSSSPLLRLHKGEAGWTTPKPISRPSPLSPDPAAGHIFSTPSPPP